jgi:polyisoprenoid-binding protein YceI
MQMMPDRAQPIALKIAAASVLFAFAVLGPAYAQSQKLIDTDRSVLTVHVYKTGLFSAFAHNHEIRAMIQSGSFSEDNPSVEFTVDSRTLKVLDVEASDSERRTIQETMLGPKVLDSERFPEIRFRSTSIHQMAEGKWAVNGDLTLHGQTRPIKVDVESSAGRYRGSAQLQQKDFGITPVSVAGGSVKVKNEVRVDFEIVGK